jgi:hypothetical protein
MNLGRNGDIVAYAGSKFGDEIVFADLPVAPNKAQSQQQQQMNN